MSVIIDANCSADALSPTPKRDFAPIMNAILEGKAKLVVGGTKQKIEYQKLATAWRYIKILDQAGKARLVSDEKVDAEQQSLLTGHALASDDPHILALARVSGARLLCSLDKLLHQDFINPMIISGPRGSVYQTAAHAHLIRKCCA